MKIRDKWGWPVTKIKGRPITNIIRILIHSNIKQTIKRRKENEVLNILCDWQCASEN